MHAMASAANATSPSPSHGIVYVKLRGPRLKTRKKGLVALRDTSGDGRANEMQVFGEDTDTGDYGTAMRIHAGHIYFTTAGEAYRQPHQVRTAGAVDAGGDRARNQIQKRTCVSDEHIAKPIGVRREGATCSCRSALPATAARNRTAGRNRRDASPAPELDWQGGVWEFKRQPAQSDRAGRAPLRDRHSQPRGDPSWNRQVGELYALQHGRDDFDLDLVPATSPAGRARCCRPRSSSRSPTGSTAAGRTTTTTSWRERRS